MRDLAKGLGALLVVGLLGLGMLTGLACSIGPVVPGPHPIPSGAECQVQVALPGSVMTIDLGMASTVIVQEAARMAQEALQEVGLTVPPVLMALASGWAVEAGTEALCQAWHEVQDWLGRERAPISGDRFMASPSPGLTVTVRSRP